VKRKQDPDQLVEMLQRVARGEPIYRWEDEHSIPHSGLVLPEGARAVSASFPSHAEQLKAMEILMDKIEPPQKNVKVDMTARAERTPIDRMLDTMSAADIARLAGRDREPDAVDAEVVEDGNKS
jgi:hypothetical protein